MGVKGTIIFFAACILFSFLWAEFGFLNTLGVLLLLLGIVGCIWGIYTKIIIKRDEKIREEVEKARKIQAEKELEQLRNGTWVFPIDKLVDALEKNGVDLMKIGESQNEYVRKKENQILTRELDSIYQTNPFFNNDRANAEGNSSAIRNAYLAKYSNVKKLQELYSKEKVNIDLRKENERKAKEEWAHSPQNGKVDKALRAQIKSENLFCCASGIEKRKQMLKRSIRAMDLEIKKKEEAAEALRQVSFLLQSSTSQKRTSDWALLGGIADGIAGPGAGLAVAADTMAKNAEIEEYNRKNRAAMSELTGKMYCNSFSVDADADQLRKVKEKLSAELKQTENKIVLSSPTTDEIFNNLQIKVGDIKETSEKILKASVSIQNNVTLNDVPDNVAFTVDGTLNADIYKNDLFVGSANIVLPLYGLECKTKKWESIDIVCGKYMPCEGTYTAKIKPNKLWVMEL